MANSIAYENDLPVGEPLEVRVVRVDHEAQCVFVRPINRQPHYERLKVNLRHVVAKESSVELCADAIRENTIYAAMVQDENFRVILIGKKPGDSSFKMFAIDVGETLQVDASQLRSDLPKSVRSPAPMCIRVNPKLGASQNDIDFFVSLQTGMTCMIEIDDLFLADFPQLMKELYPPEVTARVFKKDPGLCFSSPWRVVAYRRSRAHSGRRLEGGGGGRGGKKQEQRFRFRDFTITLPNRVNARVTRKLSSDTCIMRDTGLLDTLYDVRFVLFALLVYMEHDTAMFH
ncbi:unnamed protein product [Toxocara canis]|uniref:Tudor domain-containing protein n=1 Tax=Toxocara canis TaxID=6265 RepID=A0A183TYU6_TOXCA|nr:unnamed protein product [Toxocara canis]